MENKSLVLIGVAVLVVAGIFFFANMGQTPREGEGRVFFSITDAAADMEAISEITMTVDSVELHSEARGWTRISADNDTFELLALNAESRTALVAQANVDAGEYDSVRVNVRKVEVTTTDGATVEATLPSNSIEAAARVVVREGEDTNVTVDVMADQSLHVTAQGAFVFAPVAEFSTQSGVTVTVGSNMTVTTSGGDSESRTTVGVDADGNSRTNFRINPDQELEVDVSGNVKISGSGSATTDGGGSGGVNVDVGGGAGGSLY